MPKVTKMAGVPVIGVKGRQLGTVEDVLFHPSEPRVVGFLVRPPRFLYVFRRKSRFTPWPAGGVLVDSPVFAGTDRLLGRRAASKSLGYDWETTVIYSGMPVTISDGRMIGTVRDVGFGQETGAVRSLTISEGVANDVAVGRTTVEGDSVVGFSGGSVVVMEKTYRSTRVSGGAARVAATGVTVAKVRGEQLLKQADAALEASGVKQKVAEAPEKVGRGLGKLYRRARGAAEKAVDAYERDE